MTTGSIIPAQNIQAATVAGMIITIIQHVMSSYGLTLEPDIANGLTAFATILVAHAWDMLTGQNVTRPPSTSETK